MLFKNYILQFSVFNHKVQENTINFSVLSIFLKLIGSVFKEGKLT